MFKKFNVSRCKYLKGNYEYVIVIVLTDKDPKKLEDKTYDIEKIVRYDKIIMVHPRKKFQNPPIPKQIKPKKGQTLKEYIKALPKKKNDPSKLFYKTNILPGNKK